MDDEEWKRNQQYQQGDKEWAKRYRTSQANAGKSGDTGKNDTKADLKAKEENAKYGTPPDLNKYLKTPEQIKKFEEDAGLYSPGAQKRIRGLKLFEKHKKGLVAGGAAGGFGMILISLVFFFLPGYRVPSAMSIITNVVGEAAEEVVENRAQRMIISYLISKAGGNPSDYVIKGGLLDTLWSTFQTNRLEDKIKRQTGVSIERTGDGRIRLVHDGRPSDEINCRGMGAKKCVDTIIELSYKDSLTAHDMRRIARLTVPAWRFHKATKMAKNFKIKYGVSRYGAPDRDPNQTDAENLEELRTQQVDTVQRNQMPAIRDAASCFFEDENCERFNENDEPIDTTRRADVGDPSNSSDLVTEDLEQTAQETRNEVVRTGRSFSERMVEKLLIKLVGEGSAKVALKAIPVIGWIDFASMLNHMSIVATTNQIAARIPSLITAAAAGAMYVQWQGYGDQIKAGRMDPLFVGALTTQMNGIKGATAPLSAAYMFATGKDPAGGVPVDTRIESNLKSPRDELMSKFMGAKRWVDPLEWWYYTIGLLFRATEDLTSWILKGPTAFAMARFDELMTEVFGPEWKDKLMRSIIDLVVWLFGLVVDPLATGAKLFGQLYAGADDAYNAYCRTNLGCRAMSQVFDRGFLWSPVPGFDLSTNTIDNKQDIAVLPLSERLFSLDESNSLINTAINAAPPTNSPADWFGSIFRQVASLPSNMFNIFAGNTSAFHGTYEQKAAITGTRQYGSKPAEGSTPGDLDQDIAEQVRLQATPECPENKPEEYFNICQADKEIIGSLMCVYTNCPEFQDGTAYRPDTESGLFTDLRQLFTPRTNTANWGLW